MTRTMADYTDGIEDAAEHTAVERSVLSDGSVAFNVIYSDGNVKLRLACKSEQHAWEIAEWLGEISWVEVLS